MQVHWSSLAGNELDNQLEYYAAFNELAALRMSHEVERQVALLTKYPGIGMRLRDGELRKLVISHTPFVVIYKVTSEVLIVRLFHAAQDWPGRF